MMRDRLAAALRAQGLLPGAAERDAALRDILRAGEDERERLVARVGEGAWMGALARVDSDGPEQEAAGVLGFGLALAEHAAAASPRATEAHARAGALANFFAYLHDRLVDGGVRPARVFPGAAIALLPAPRALRALALAAPSPARLLLRLVSDWSADLARLDARVPTLAVARRMYAAQMACVRRAATDADVRDKAVLPFVAMASPAWPVADPGRAAALAWVARMGEAFSWVDDAVDLEDDREEGAPNRVDRALATASEDEVVARIAALAADVARGWSPARPPTPRAAAAFRMALWSWVEE